MCGGGEGLWSLDSWPCARHQPHEALQELGNPSRPVTLCVTDPFLTPKGMRKLQWITVTKDTPQTKDMGRHEMQVRC